MKKNIISAFIMLSSLLSFSQNDQIDTYSSVVDKIKTTYNNKDYKEFYNLLSPYFKTQQTEKDITSFLKDNVFAYYGKINTLSFIKKKDEFNYYKTECENGNLEMLLACNEKMEIEGFSFAPMAEEVPSVEKQFISDNKKQSILDLKVDSIVFKFMSNPINSGLSIGIIQNNTTFFYQYGEIKKEFNQLPNKSTIYEIGSVTKTFTGLLLAHAIADKKISIDDDIRKYLPKQCSGLQYQGTPITIKHLVTHTSRIPRIPENIEQQTDYDELNPYKNYDKKMVYDYLSTLKLDTLPGIKLDYSNTGMALLGIILEKVYDQSYEALASKYIFESFQMNNSYVNVPTNQFKNFATGYSGKGLETPHWDLGDQVGAGGIKSTIEDMALYLKGNIEDVSNAIKMTHDVQFKNSKESIALAWFIQKTKSGNTLIWHNGGTYGFTSFCGFVIEKKCGVVLLSNSGTGVDELAINILRYLQK